MKQYTTIKQTTQLIDLKLLPKYISKKPISEEIKTLLVCEGFSIGELIEILPKSISHPHNTSLNFYLAISFLQSEQWYVDYETCDSALYSVAKSELVDALCDMIVKLKEEGVI